MSSTGIHGGRSGSGDGDVTIIDPIGQDTMANSVSVTIASDQTDLPIDTTGLATEAKQDTGNTLLASIDGKLTNPLPVSGPLTDTELRATPVPVSAINLDIRDLAFATDTVDVSGSDVTVSSLPAISGTVTADQGAPNTAANAWPAKITDGTDVADVAAANVNPTFASNPGLTVDIGRNMREHNSSIFNAPYPVPGLVTMGHVTVGASVNTVKMIPLSDGGGSSLLRYIDGAVITRSVPAGNRDSGSVLGALNATSQPYGGYELEGHTSTFQIKDTGSFVGTVTLYGYVPYGGSALPIMAIPHDGGPPTITPALDKIYSVPSGALQYITFRVTAYTSGSCTVYMQGSNGAEVAYTASTVMNGAGAAAVNIQDGGNTITVDGTVAVTGGLTDAELRATPVPVTADQGAPGSTSQAWPIIITDGLDQALVTAANALQVDGSAVTQPVSVASLPLPTGAAIAANQLPDGHNVTVDNAAGAAAVNIQDGGNTITVDGAVDVTKTALTPASPTAATVGVATGLAVASNASRKGLILVNTSSARISFGFGVAAVLDSGITLYPGGSYNMGEYDFNTAAVNAIASAAASNLGIQEFT